MSAVDARGTILAALGVLHVEHGARRVPGPQLFSITAELGVPERAARSALERLRAQGVVNAQREGRRIDLALTNAYLLRVERSHALLRRADLFDPREQAWTLISFSVPEERRAIRHRVRRLLRWYGCGPLNDGVWLAPRVLDVDAVQESLRVPAADVGMAVLRIAPDDAVRDADQARVIWDVDGAADAHREFQRRRREAPAGGSELAAEVALVRDALQVVDADPRLPRHLLPADWVGSATADALVVFRAGGVHGVA